ncbi:MAG TPA: hypothetical protein PLB97_06470 [Accumulibacter sp.]|jgi:hypothetical protein|nr:hypothetical protein [Accumulibacter sp.]HPP46130.1 hypothetical protein [Accumulibacter sp.]
MTVPVKRDVVRGPSTRQVMGYVSLAARFIWLSHYSGPALSRFYLGGHFSIDWIGKKYCQCES